MKKGGKVIFGGNQHGRVIGGGMVSLKPTMSINNVLLVNGLKYNLLSVSQLCDSENSVVFNRDQCIVNNSNRTRLFVANRRGNLYKIEMSELSDQKVSYLMTLKEDHWLWHRKCGHASLELLSKLQRYNLMRGLPNMSFKDNLLCESCVKGKQVRSSFKSKDEVFTQRPLELIHLDLFGPTRTASISDKRND